MYSPAASARRIARNDYAVPNTNLIIKKGRNGFKNQKKTKQIHHQISGTTVVIPVHGIHNDPDIYENPTIFNPDRFSKNEISKRSKFSFLPFGAGLRGCVGIRFAMLEMKISMAKILSEFNEFEIDEGRMESSLKFDLHKVLLSPIGGCFLKFRK